MVVKRSSKKLLGEKIAAKLNKSKTQDFDIEDENFHVTSKGTDDSDKDDVDDDNEEEELSKREHYVNVSKSKIRDTTINLGEKYVGAKVGRDQLFEGSDNEELLGESENSGDDRSALEESSDDVSVSVSHNDSEEDKISSEVEIESGLEEEDYKHSDEDIETDAFKRDRIAKLLDHEKQQILSRLSTSAKSDALKGYTVLKQGSEYDSVLDARIKIQKAVISSNHLPINRKIFSQFKRNETDAILNSTEEKLYSLIDRLLRLRSNQLVKDGLLKDQVMQPNSKKRKLSDYLEANKKINQAVEPVTKSVLIKWSNRVQSASGVGALNQGKFKVINQSVWNQVNNQLGDLERLVKKTKINRRGITPLGYDASLQDQDNDADKGDKDVDASDSDDADDDDDKKIQNAGLSNVDKSLQSNPYIFDDDDFYRLLLNDMINKKLDQKQAHSSAVLMLSKNKMQKNYERMATKGRKLKYTIQEPLQQFEIPRRKYYTWNDDQIDELFAGLFGLNFKMDESDESDDETVTDEQKAEDITKLRESAVKLFG